MIVVKAQPGETSDSLIRKFSKKVLFEGILQEYREHEFYQKPAEIRKERNKMLKNRKYKRGKKSY